MNRKAIVWGTLWSLLSLTDVQADGVRNFVHIVGSSALQPFASAVSDKIVKSGKIKRPKLESTGTSGGFTLFCEGVGMDYPDIVNSWRPMRKKEFDTCQSNGVKDIVEVKIGYDGVVMAQSKKAQPFGSLSEKEIYLALAKQLPDPACKQYCDNKLVPNPNKTWKQINSSLPDTKIEVLGPPLTAGTSEVFGEVVLEAGCNGYPWLAAKKLTNEKEYKRLCHDVRKDGGYVEEINEMIVSRLATDPEAVGLFSYNWLRENTDRLIPIAIEGIKPDRDSIASQKYPVSRPLFFYVKKAHIDRVPGLSKYIAEFTSEKAWGDKGYLASKGLIPMSLDERKAYAADAKDLKSMVSVGEQAK